MQTSPSSGLASASQSNGSQPQQPPEQDRETDNSNTSREVRFAGPGSPTSTVTIKDKGKSMLNGVHTPSDTRSGFESQGTALGMPGAGANMTRTRLLPLTTSTATNSVTITGIDAAALSSPTPQFPPYQQQHNSQNTSTSPPKISHFSPNPNSNTNGSNGSAPNWPALHLLPLNDTFIPKQVSLYPPGTRIKIGRQTNAKTAPASINGYFDSKVLSRMHAEVWFEGQPGKVFIKDVGSSNGTFINGDRLSLESQKSDVFELHSEDIVEFGIDIASEDNKTILHHKVAAKAYIAADPEDADRLAKQMPGIQLKMGLGPPTGSGLQDAGAAQAMRRMSRAGVASSGMSFDHVLSRLQSELQKSRETGIELNSLTSTMSDIRTHLAPGSGPPPPLPPYPITRVPPLNPNAGAANNNAITNLQTQLSETQSNLTSHVDKLGKLESLLSQHDSLKAEVAGLREEMRVAKAEMDEMLLAQSMIPASTSTRVDFDDDFDDDNRSIASVDTVRPDEEDEQHADLPKEMPNRPQSAIPSIPNGIPIANGAADAHSLTVDDVNAMLKTQNAALMSRLDMLAAQLESATQLGATLRMQHAQAAQLTQQLSERIQNLEKRTPPIAESDLSHERFAAESQAKWEGWKAAFEKSWQQDRESWQDEREKLREIIAQWEEKEAKISAALLSTDKGSPSPSQSRRSRSKRRRRLSPASDSSESESDEATASERHSSALKQAGGARRNASALQPIAGSQSAGNQRRTLGIKTLADHDAAHSDSSDGTTTAVFSAPSHRHLSSAKSGPKTSADSNHMAMTTMGAVGVAALALTIWSVMNKGD